MASSTIFMKRHDQRPHLDVALQDIDGQAIDLDAAVDGVTFTMVDANTKQTIKVNRGLCTIIDAATGQVRYS
tara:strand:- start:4081 stop:4296 length:216 start_codon:yes stop_codon:yes gene_type:complete